ncbi:DUF4350 domain-containing protein [Thermococcus thermotolerans]|uniref:DUF4350 domain-containing protein n=1 Tax=Thermococcus thermotolerans TaxID=2969672 RepID=UPI0021570751|nr:DUF4350 domain-containing protein [Thermococcus thermotolerans]
MNRVFYGILLVVGIGLIVMPLSVPVFKSDAPYSVLNTKWNGLSSFGRLLYTNGEVTPILAPYDSVGLEDLEGTLVVVGPDVGFSSGEVEELKSFLEKGNTLLLADDFGTGNQLLEGLGLKVRLSKKPVLSLTYSKNADFPVTMDVRDPELAKGVSLLVMSRPSAILNVQNALVYTSNASMLGGTYGAFPVVVRIPYGKGTIILVSDPDIFTNSLYRENEPFLKNLVEGLPKKTFYIDEAHHADFNPYSSGSIVIRRAVNRELVFYYVLFVAFIAFIVESGIAGRILAWLASLVARFFREEEISQEELIRRLEEKGLDGDKLKTILEEIRTGSRIGGAHGR